MRGNNVHLDRINMLSFLSARNSRWCSGDEVRTDGRAYDRN